MPIGRARSWCRRRRIPLRLTTGRILEHHNGFCAAIPLSVTVTPALAPIIVVTVLALAHGLGLVARGRARARLAAEYVQTARRPYQLGGYPELLAVQPRNEVEVVVRRSREHAGDYVQRFRREIQGESEDGAAAEDGDADDGDGRREDRDGHDYIVVSLRFAGDGPENLDAVLRGFDDSLARWPSKHISSRFRGTSPVTPQHGKAGPLPWTEDTNAEVRAWVHRFDANVLQPLHRAHELDGVDLELR